MKSSDTGAVAPGIGNFSSRGRVAVGAADGGENGADDAEVGALFDAAAPDALSCVVVADLRAQAPSAHKQVTVNQ
ncbi:MAG TPA: hypothetical protein VGM44_25620 [Polyangiaceae bacterium]|jgi:hypothetical protein